MVVKKTALKALCLAAIAIAVHAETITVTSTAVQGAGSLSSAIDQANSDPSPSKIVFAIPGGGEIVTGHHAWFPEITSEVEIDGSNSSGAVTLIGAAPTGPGAPVSGLVFEAGSDNSVVSNIKTEGFLNAIEVKGVTITVKNSLFTSPFARGVMVENSEGTLIQNNSFTGSTSLCAAIDNSTNVAFIGNYVTSGQLYVRNSIGSVIGATGDGQGNIFDGNSDTEAAIIVFSNSKATRIMNNVIKNQLHIGLGVYGSDSSNVAFNTFENNKKTDIKVEGGASNKIFRNTITGDELAHEAGISVDASNGVSLVGNILDNARLTIKNVNGATVGGVLDDGNVIKNDSFGFSGSGAIILHGSTNVSVINNQILDNASQGIMVDGDASGNLIYANTIKGNGRSGIKAVNGMNNTFSKNLITDHNAAAGGGVNSISLIGSANGLKVAPVITSATKSGNIITVTGTTSGASDEIEVFVSSASDGGLHLMTDAERYATTAYATNGIWSASFSATPFEGPAELFLTATGTDQAGNTSKLALNEKVVLNNGIVGPGNVSVGEVVRYVIERFDGVEYQWWLSGDATVLSGDGSNTITAQFNASGATVPVNVGFTHPENGWMIKTLQVTVE